MTVFDDADAEFLASIAGSLESTYVTETERAMWAGSPFQWIRTRPSRQVGAIGEKLVAAWAAAQNFDVARPLNTGHDRIIEGLKVEIKLSTLWTANRIFKFQQIRDQDYDYCLCLGISPNDVSGWFIPKSELLTSRPPSLVPQHGGASGQDTKWLSFTADAPPAWLEPYGGRLRDVARLISEAIPR